MRNMKDLWGVDFMHKATPFEAVLEVKQRDQVSLLDFLPRSESEIASVLREGCLSWLMGYIITEEH